MSTAVFEHAYFIGNYLGGLLLGVDIVLYFQSLHALLDRRDTPWRNRGLLISFSTFLLALLILDKATVSVWGEQMWITYADDPLYIVTHAADPYFTAGTVAAALILLSGDAFLIYRCYMLWAKEWMVVALPILMWFAYLALAILQIMTSAAPNGNFFGSRAISFGIPYYALSIAINCLVSGLIVFKISMASRNVAKTMGKEHIRPYTRLINVVVESALPYSLIGFMTIIPYGMGKDVSIAFGQVYITFGAIAPQMIILRVARGNSWDRTGTTTAPVGSMVFRNTGSTSIPTDTLTSYPPSSDPYSYSETTTAGSASTPEANSVKKQDFIAV